ncbi:MAG: hypothetical protein H7337_20045 [Rhizobacter sp.]|nr:hypothetical protein [Rhizobacter sp.]
MAKVVDAACSAVMVFIAHGLSAAGTIAVKPTLVFRVDTVHGMAWTSRAKFPVIQRPRQSIPVALAVNAEGGFRCVICDAVANEREYLSSTNRKSSWHVLPGCASELNPHGQAGNHVEPEGPQQSTA